MHRRLYLEEMASRGSKECMLFVVTCTKKSETVNVTESFSEAMEDVSSAITDGQWP